MSNHTISRIPPKVRHLLNIYSTASKRISASRSDLVNDFLHHTSKEYQTFHFHKLIRDNEYRKKDFPPAMRKMISELFRTPLDLGKQEMIDLSRLRIMDNDNEDKRSNDPIYSYKSSTVRNFTDYHAKIFTLFSSSYNPLLHVPRSNFHINSFKWYLKLLQKTPVIIILSQNNHLFSESSLCQMNKPFFDLKRAMNALGNQLSEKVSKEGPVRNYHLTELVTIDIFSLALKSNSYFKENLDKEFSTIFQSLNWNEVNCRQDALANKINSSRVINILKTSSESLKDLPDDIEEEYPLETMKSQTITGNFKELIPYDVKYNDFYVLTIESPVLDCDHSGLLNFLETSGFELLAARLSLDNGLIRNYLSENSIKEKEASNYEGLLRQSLKTKLPPQNIEKLITKFGELGLTTVEQDVSRSGIYLLPPA